MSAQIDKLAGDIARAKSFRTKCDAAMIIAEANANDSHKEVLRLEKAFEDEIKRVREAAEATTETAV